MSDRVWMRDPEGVYAYVPAADVDTWRVRGVVPDAEPATAPEFVWMAHPDLSVPSKIAWGARNYWTAKGFVPAPPPQPQDLTKDPVLDDTDDEPQTEPAPEPAKSTAAAKPAPASKE